ncbi:MAG: hypothetical protein O9293_03390 [Porphyrobacter sp.]|nr:hypothetical protein [Porphyrobacter sp.]
MQNGWIRSVLAALVAASSPSAVAAQEAPAAAPRAEPSNEIEVRAERRLEREQVRESVRQIAAPLAFSEVVPRFHDPVCPKVVGVDAKVARLIEARISAVADFVELAKPKPKCSPNAIVLILEQPPEMFEKVMNKRFGLLGPRDIRDQTVNSIRADLRAGRPVVAWNQIAVRNNDGPTILDGSSIPVSGGGFGEGLPVIQTPFASRLRSNTFRAKEVSVVVFDMKQLVGVEAIQLADLASLYLFGTPRRNIDFDTLGASTLLTLFRDGPKASPEEMTDFDRAYLMGIYSLRRNEWSNRLNRSVMAAYDEQCTEEGAQCAEAAPAAAEGK